MTRLLLLLLLLLFSSFTNRDVQAQPAPMFRVAPTETIPFFDPRFRQTRLPYSPIDGVVVVEGDIALGSADEVLARSYSLAIKTAECAIDNRYKELSQQLDDQTRQQLQELAKRDPSKFPDGLERKKRIVAEAIKTIEPLLRMRESERKDTTQQQSAVILADIAGKSFRWPQGNIPYVIDAKFKANDRKGQREDVEKAIQHWNKRAKGLVKLVEIKPGELEVHEHRVRFIAVSGGCYSDEIGRSPQPREQKIGLCHACGVPQIIHEIGHVVGLFHEHNRNDRDNYIETLPENMKAGAVQQYTTMGWRGEDVGKFDFDSIMLYPAKAFSKNNQPTMKVKDKVEIPPAPNWGINSGGVGGRTTELSEGDVEGVRHMYGDKAGADAAPAANEQATSRAASIELDIKLPTANAAGSIRAAAPSDVVLKHITDAIPLSVRLPPQKFGDKAIYRDVRANNATVANLKPTSLQFRDNALFVAASPRLTGVLDMLYEHVVVTTELQTVGNIGGRDIKMDVPVVNRDWRPKPSTPFQVDVAVAGHVTPSIVTGDCLADLRLQLECTPDKVQITSVKVTTDDPLLKFAGEIVGVVGKSLPNEAFNQPIRDNLARTLSIDPFRHMSKPERAELHRITVSDASVTIAAQYLVLTAELHRKGPR